MDSGHRDDVPRPELIAMRPRAALLLACCCTWISSCSVPYREDHTPNLTFSAPGLRGSFLSSTSVRLAIFFAEPDCGLDYRGSVSIHPGGDPHTIGVPTGHYLYARILYSHSGFLSNRTRQRSHELRFKPQPGYQYEIRYKSTKSAYETKLIRKRKGSSRERELDLDGWNSCRDS